MTTTQICDNCGNPVRSDTEGPHEWIHEDGYYRCHLTNHAPTDSVATVAGSTLVPEPKPTRKAVVLSKSSALETVQRYLPGNYEAQNINGFVVITGQDNAGWTLDDYVIPRLASGLHTAIEVRYLETEEEHEVLFNSGDTPEYGRDYFTGPFGDVLVPVK